MNPIVLTLIGDDRTGLVEALADVVVAHGGSWERSHVTELAGVFAGVVLVLVPADRVEDLREALADLRERGVLDVTMRPAVLAAADASDGASTETSAGGDDGPADGPAPILVEVVGSDRPGIVHEVSRALAGAGAGIVDLRTWTETAAMAGGVLFRAAAHVRVPDGGGTDELRAALEDLPDTLMVDIVD